MALQVRPNNSFSPCSRGHLSSRKGFRVNQETVPNTFRSFLESSNFYIQTLLVVILITTVVFARIDAASQTTDRDSISLTGLESSETFGVLITEQQSTNSIVSHAATGTNESGTVHGNFIGSPGGIIAFTDKHAPSAITHNWTSGSDRVTLDLEPSHCFKLQAWIVTGDFQTQSAKAIDDKITAGAIWDKEKQGLCVSPLDSIDVTKTPPAKKYSNQSIECSTNTLDDLHNNIGHTEDAINVYYVDMVTTTAGSGLSYGLWCGGPDVLMGKQTSNHVLVHELGHAFSLHHIDCYSTLPPPNSSCSQDKPILFDTANVMHSASKDRISLTEGQTFRSIMNNSSAINSSFHMRDGKTIHKPDCLEWLTTTDPICPAIQRRLWEDKRDNGAGVWPADKCPSGNCQ